MVAGKAAAPGTQLLLVLQQLLLLVRPRDRQRFGLEQGLGCHRPSLQL